MLLKSFLKCHSNFKHLTEADLDALAHALSIEDCLPVLAGSGRQSRKGFVYPWWKASQVTRYNPLTGESEELKMIKPGEMFGLLSLADNLLPSPAAWRMARSRWESCRARVTTFCPNPRRRLHWVSSWRWPNNWLQTFAPATTPCAACFGDPISLRCHGFPPGCASIGK